MFNGLPPELRAEMYERDNYRCRWCGTTNQPVDLHHIRYRRGKADDVPDNLITLCRTHHTFVHDSYAIPKMCAQEILRYLISEEGAGKTGLSQLRQRAVP